MQNVSKKLMHDGLEGNGRSAAFPTNEAASAIGQERSRKRRKNRKLIAGVAGLLTLGVLLSACSSGDGDTVGTATSTGSREAAEETTERPKISWSVYDRGNIAPSEGTVTDNRWTRWINENGPAEVTFVAIPRFESREKFNTLFASGDVPDVINEYDTSYRDQLYNQKQLLPLDDLVDEHMPNYKKLLDQYPIMRDLGTKPDGKLYEIGNVKGSTAQVVVVIRQDWLDKLSLDIPETPDELIEVAKAFTEQDPDGNGVDDTYGYSLAWLGDEAIDAMYGNAMFDRNGELVEEDERMEAAIAFKKRLFDEGVIDRDYLTDKNGEKSKKDFFAGKLGIYVADSPSVDFLTNLKTTVPDAIISPMLMPETEFGQYTIRMQNPLQMTTVVYAGAKDPVAAVKAIDFMIAESTWSMLRNGVEGSHWEKDENGCPAFINSDLRKTEMSYTGDMMLMASILYEDENCNVRRFDKTIPNIGEYLAFRKTMRELYENPEVPLYTITHPTEHMPTLPADLMKVKADWTEQSKDIIAKTVVGGSGYSVERGMNELVDLRQKIGQDKTMVWYQQWYAENKDTALLTPDMYIFLAKEEY